MAGCQSMITHVHGYLLMASDAADARIRAATRSRRTLREKGPGWPAAAAVKGERLPHRPPGAENDIVYRHRERLNPGPCDPGDDGPSLRPNPGAPGIRRRGDHHDAQTSDAAGASVGRGSGAVGRAT